MTGDEAKKYWDRLVRQWLAGVAKTRAETMEMLLALTKGKP